MHVQVNGVRLFFDVEGTGLEPHGPEMLERPTLVLLHGGPGFDHTSFRPEFSPLSEVAQVIYLDHRGNGRSERSNPDHWTLAQWGDDVRGFCEALGLERPIVMGHSFGGMVAMSYATRHPTHVGKLILAGTSARQNLPRMLERFEQIGGATIRETARQFWTQPGPATAPAYLQTVWPLYNRTQRDPQATSRAITNPEVLFHFAAGEQTTYNLVPDLHKIHCPTLVIGGALDPVCPIEDQEEILAALPERVGRLERFENCGHSVWRDEPQRAFELLRAFITART